MAIQRCDRHPNGCPQRGTSRPGVAAAPAPTKPPPSTSTTRPVFLADAPPPGQARFRSLPDDEVAVNLREAAERALKFAIEDLKLGSLEVKWFARELDVDRRDLAAGLVAYKTFDDHPMRAGMVWHSDPNVVNLRVYPDEWAVFRAAAHEAWHSWEFKRGLLEPNEASADAYEQRVEAHFRRNGWS